MKVKLTNTTYNLLNALSQVVLPAAGTLYFALAAIWSLPNAEKVVGSIVALDTFLGVVQAWFKKNYKPPTQGTVLIDKSDPAGAIGLKFQLNTHVDDIQPGKKFLMDVADYAEGDKHVA
jgi:hypothetical protein